jgi:erythronate-4-phosphate dehydrogenase
MIIAIDQALPYWEECFSDLGEVRPFAGRELRAEALRDVDALVVRTVTAVDASLLEGTAVRFVGAASAGMDHVDRGYLERRGIHFRHAAGCNADAVSEYVLAALHVLARRKGWTLSSKSLAVVGVGNVGSRVARKAAALGMETLLCDPPLREAAEKAVSAGGAASDAARYLPFEEVLGADILTFHVPLAASGPHPTWHMLGREALGSLAPHQLVVNASRGEVCDRLELARALREKRILGAVLDVWESEPEIDYPLLELADIGTPHVAGTTLDGKIKAVTMIRERLCEFLGVSRPLDTAPFYPETRRIRLRGGGTAQEAVAEAVRAVYDIEADDAGLRALALLEKDGRGKSFEQLRTRHALRPEFPHFVVEPPAPPPSSPPSAGDAARRRLAGIGFQVDAAP